MFVWFEGFIGCGNVVESKSGPAFNNNETSFIYAIMRRKKERAEQSAKKLNAEKWYDNIEDLLKDDKVNAVYIATPPGLHYEQAIKCCEAKKPTYIKKPFARNYSEAKEITEMFQKANVPLYIAHYRRALPKFIKLKQLIDKNAIGDVLEVDFRLNRKYKQEEVLNSWLYNIELSGGGKFYDIAPHTIDIMIYLFGNFTKVYGLATNNNKDYLVEDMATMCFETEKGIIGSANFNSLAFDKEDKMLIYGTKGTIELSIHGNSPIKVKVGENIQELFYDNPKIIQSDMIGEVIKELLEGKQTNTCHGAEALEIYRVIDEVLDKYYNGRNDKFWENFEKS